MESKVITIEQDGVSPIIIRHSCAEEFILFIEQGIIGRGDINPDNIVCFVAKLPDLIAALQSFLPKETE